MANSKAERGHFAGARGARMIKEQRGGSCEAKSGATQAAHSDESLYPGSEHRLGTAKRSKAVALAGDR